MDNFAVAKKIIGLLGGKEHPGILAGLVAACAECDKCGPPEGMPCMCLRLALDMDVEYEPPEWCKDRHAGGNFS